MSRKRVIRRRRDKKSRAYWATIDRIARQVQKMPQWMKGGESVRAQEEKDHQP